MQTHFPPDTKLAAPPLGEAWLEVRWRLKEVGPPRLLQDPDFPFALGALSSARSETAFPIRPISRPVVHHSRYSRTSYGTSSGPVRASGLFFNWAPASPPSTSLNLIHGSRSKMRRSTFVLNFSMRTQENFHNST
jgi:hypothetical protein